MFAVLAYDNFMIKSIYSQLNVSVEICNLLSYISRSVVFVQFSVVCISKTRPISVHKIQTNSLSHRQTFSAALCFSFCHLRSCRDRCTDFRVLVTRNSLTNDDGNLKRISTITIAVITYTRRLTSCDQQIENMQPSIAWSTTFEASC